MKVYEHPEISEVTLPAVMQALSDPCRIAIVRELLAQDRPLACNEVPLDISKATRSHHFEVLRDAGLIHTAAEGTKCMTTLRRDDIEGRFPGLLSLVSSADEPVSA
ncbi:MAG TPA: helix-turn-helix domain-containing protein [Luteolibacter sp.]|nr:helix-turn-helix domain-containing protein [Luteolibacter sp.]